MNKEEEIEYLKSTNERLKRIKKLEEGVEK